MHLRNVKSTMLIRLLDIIIPHYCCSCGNIGQILCESCKYDIVSEQFQGCLLCGSTSPFKQCRTCNDDVDQSWCGGERVGALEELIDKFKFEYASSAHIPLGDILLAALPHLPENTIVVPVPTVASHIRQRGYDHAALLSKYIAEKRGLTHAPLLRRATSTVQRGASRQDRIKQAKKAFVVDGELKLDAPYLIIDDVATTGATLRYAAKTLRAAGVKTVWVAAVARQPLD